MSVVTPLECPLPCLTLTFVNIEPCQLDVHPRARITSSDLVAVFRCSNWLHSMSATVSHRHVMSLGYWCRVLAKNRSHKAVRPSSCCHRLLESTHRLLTIPPRDELYCLYCPTCQCSFSKRQRYLRSQDILRWASTRIIRRSSVGTTSQAFPWLLGPVTRCGMRKYLQGRQGPPASDVFCCRFAGHSHQFCHHVILQNSFSAGCRPNQTLTVQFNCPSKDLINSGQEFTCPSKDFINSDPRVHLPSKDFIN